MHEHMKKGNLFFRIIFIIHIFIMIIIMAWWQVGHGKSSSTATNLYNTIVTNSNPNWQWLTVGSKWSH